jgi:hypothetical protein
VRKYKDNYPEAADEIYSRKSFSVINNKFRYEVSSEGNFLWDLSSSPEIEASSDKIKQNKELKSKAEIFYSGKIENN